MIRRKRSSRLAYTLMLLALYLLLFPVPIEKELILMPAWWVDLSLRERQSQPLGDPPALRPFRVDSRLGYYDPAGAVHNWERVLYDAAISDTLYINYSQLPVNIVLKSPDGGFLGSLRSSRYPLLDRSGERVFLVNAESTGLSEVSRDGEEIWRVEFASVITSVAIESSALLVGLADGSLKLYDREGSLLYGLRPKGSRIPIVMGCAVSENAIAAVAGLDPQQLVVAQKRDGRFEPTIHMDLESDFRREVRLTFSAAGERLYFEDAGGLGILTLDRRGVVKLPMTGRIRSLAESPEGLLAIAHEVAGTSGLRIHSFTGVLHYREELPVGSVFLDWTGQGLVVGYGDNLVGLELRRE